MIGVANSNVCVLHFGNLLEMQVETEDALATSCLDRIGVEIRRVNGSGSDERVVNIPDFPNVG